jgi:hypothetical protein
MQAAMKRQEKHAATLTVGARVAYSAMWLKSTCAGQTYAKLRGTILQIGGTFPAGFTNSDGEDLGGQVLSDRFALVQWDGASTSRMVAKYNLARLKSAAFAEAPHMGKRSR